MGLLHDNVKKELEIDEEKFTVPSWVTEEPPNKLSLDSKRVEEIAVLKSMIKDYDEGFRNIDTISLLITAAIEKVVWKEIGMGFVCMATHFVSEEFVKYHMTLFVGNFWQGKNGEKVMYQILHLDMVQVCCDLMDAIRKRAQIDLEVLTDSGLTIDELFALESYRVSLEGPADLFDAYEMGFAKRTITIIQGGSI